MSLWQKVSYGGVLCLSVAMICMAIIRMIGVLATMHRNNIGTSPIWATFWEVIEGCVAVIMACFLTFRSVFATGSNKSHADAVAARNRLWRWPGTIGTLWDRILLTLSFRSKSRVSSSTAGEEREAGMDCGRGGKGPGEDDRGSTDYLIPTVAVTRPTLVFSRLRTMFGSTTKSQVASQTSYISEETVDVVTESELRELDYHHVIR